MKIIFHCLSPFQVVPFSFGMHPRIGAAVADAAAAATTVTIITKTITATFSSVHSAQKFSMLCELFTVWLHIFTIETCSVKNIKLRSKASSSSLQSPHHAKQRGSRYDSYSLYCVRCDFVCCMCNGASCIHNGPVYMLFIFFIS